MALPNFNKVVGSKWQFSARCNRLTVSWRIFFIEESRRKPVTQTENQPHCGLMIGRYVCTKAFTFLSNIVRHIPPHISTDQHSNNHFSVLDYLSNLNPKNRNNNNHFCRSQHNWRPSTSVNGRFISARLRLMMLSWPKQMDAGWTTPIDARRLDGRVRQTDGAQPYWWLVGFPPFCRCFFLA